METRDTGSPIPSPYTPPPAPKRSKKRTLGIGCLGLVILFIVIAAIASHGKNNNDTNATATSVETSAPADSPSPYASVSLDPSPITNASDPLAVGAPPITKTVLNIKGNADKNTPTFTVGDDWSIKYTFDCHDFGDKGNFAIEIYGSDGTLASVAVNTIDMTGGDTTYEHGMSGTYYLDISSECGWTVKVTDGDTGQ